MTLFGLGVSQMMQNNLNHVMSSKHNKTIETIEF